MKSGIYIVHSDYFPLPSFEIHFFPRKISLRRAGRFFFEFIAQKDAFLKPFPHPLFFSVILILFLSPFSFFSLTLDFYFFPQLAIPPPPNHSILNNIYPCMKLRQFFL